MPLRRPIAPYRLAPPVLALALVLLAATACSERSAAMPRSTSSAMFPDSTPVLIAVGDIADCRSAADEATARIVDTIAGTVAVLGDNAYPNGTDRDYANCYAPTWGRHRARTRPTPGNHEYRTTEAGGYFRYFGAAAGTKGKGYYSYDLAGWHIVVLNSSDGCREIGCGPNSAQLRWLRDDLALHPTRCTLAYWHHPRFNSGRRHGSNPSLEPIWEALYEAGADVVLNGHEHLYERFAPQRPDGTADAVRGIRQFTIGTGGRERYGFGAPHPNSEYRDDNTYGILKLELQPDGYRWEYVVTEPGARGDRGEGKCH